MTIDIKFSFVCEKQFYELKGESEQVRLCEKCQLEVFNLDPLNDEQRLVLFEDASKNNKKICVSTTFAIKNEVPCSQSLFPLPDDTQLTAKKIPVENARIRMGGEPAIAPDQLARERARIEQLKSKQQDIQSTQSWWEKLKFW